MQKAILLFLSFIIVSSIHSQVTLDFEDQVDQIDTFRNGQTGEGDFDLGKVIFPNEYDFQNDFWSGQWAMSSSTDSTTPNFTNLYGSVAGKGKDESGVYAVAQEPIYGNPLHIAFDGPIVPQDVYINNTAYAYFVIRDGNEFSKAFGGPSGEDPDYFYVEWNGFLNGELQGSREFYLADYRAENSADDYIIKDWTNFNLSELGLVDSIGIEFYSSDTGDFGINTPLFFAIDNFSFDFPSSVSIEESSKMKIYPNPTVHFLYFERKAIISDLSLFDLQGQQYPLGAINNKIDVSHLPAGAYFLRWRNKDKWGVKKFFKK